jgi:hypothetical protein
MSAYSKPIAGMSKLKNGLWMGERMSAYSKTIAGMSK